MFSTGARKWSSYSQEIYLSGKPPLLGTVDLAQLEQKAREASKGHLDAFGYTFGSAGTSSTYRDNLKAFKRYKIVPRMLVNATVRSLETTIFGVKLPSPMLIAPVGVQGIMHPDAELATARAARNLGVPFIMSTASTRSIEEVAEANGDGHRWYQLYWPRTNEVILSLLKRASENGFTTLVATLDTMFLGWRPLDLETAYLPFVHGVGSQVGTSDPVFMARYNLKPRVNEHPEFPHDSAKSRELVKSGDAKAKENAFLGREWIGECNSGVFRTWEDVEFLKDNWSGRLVLKGIQSVADAEKAIEIGLDGIIVSNHGGRQVDGAIASLLALEAICLSSKVKTAQASGKFTVLFDSGIRTGSDIIKAMALGAQGVLLGRPWVYGLAIGGQGGVEQVIKQILADTEITLGLSGYKNLQEIQGRSGEIVRVVDSRM